MLSASNKTIAVSRNGTRSKACTGPWNDERLASFSGGGVLVP